MGNGDNTYDFTDIPKLLEPLKSGEADHVLGSRFKGEIKKGKSGDKLSSEDLHDEKPFFQKES